MVEEVIQAIIDKLPKQQNQQQEAKDEEEDPTEHQQHQNQQQKTVIKILVKVKVVENNSEKMSYPGRNCKQLIKMVNVINVRYWDIGVICVID